MSGIQNSGGFYFVDWADPKRNTRLLLSSPFFGSSLPVSGTPVSPLPDSQSDHTQKKSFLIRPLTHPWVRNALQKTGRFFKKLTIPLVAFSTGLGGAISVQQTVIHKQAVELRALQEEKSLADETASRNYQHLFTENRKLQGANDGLEKTESQLLKEIQKIRERARQSLPKIEGLGTVLWRAHPVLYPHLWTVEDETTKQLYCLNLSGDETLTLSLKKGDRLEFTGYESIVDLPTRESFFSATIPLIVESAKIVNPTSDDSDP